MSGVALRRDGGAGPPPPVGPSPYVELGVQSCFSFGHGASHAAELVLRARVLGYERIGIADRNTLAGVVRMFADGREAGIETIVGTRLDFHDGPSVLAWAKDRAGYGRLSRIVTRGKLAAGDGDHPDAARRNLAKGTDWSLSVTDMAGLTEGIVFALAPTAASPAGPMADVDELEAALPALLDHVPLSHVAAAPRLGARDRARIGRLDALARTHGLKLLATNDVAHADRADRPLHDVLACIRERTTLVQAGRLLAMNGERHLKPPAEMVALFADFPHAIHETRRVADACAFRLDELRYQYPHEPVPEGYTPDAWLRELTYRGAAGKYPAGVPESVRATIEKELALVAKKEIARYFLTVRDIVHFARHQVEPPILCQGRGSAANSAVCFCLGITNVDPAKMDVLFERFLSEARDEPPDIDVDFEHERREEVIQHIYARYGRERAGLAATVIHYRPRMAVREAGRVMGLSEQVTAALAKTVWGSWGSSIAVHNMREAGLDPEDPHLRRTVTLASRLIGLPRHLSQHVGGFVLTDGPLVEMVPVRWGAMPDRSYIEWDKDDIDRLGIFKIDVLALGMLSAIRRAFDLIEATGRPRPDIAEVGAEENSEPGVYDMLGRADSLGVFQIESRAQMAMLPRLKPRCFYDLVIEVAIVRPGPIQGDMVHPYLRRRNREETIVYPAPGPGHPQDELQKILGRTLGVPIFQEQAMAIAMHAAEFTAGEANELRRAMATFRSRGTIEELQGKMVGRMVERGYDQAFAQRCFDQIKGFGEYGFPESHAASFAFLVYVSCWLKWRHPEVFAAALLNAQPMGFYAPAQIVRDARAHGVEVRRADVNASGYHCTLEELAPEDRHPGAGLNGVHPPTHALRLGLRQVDGVGERPMEALVVEREANGPFRTVAELHARTGLPRDRVEVLAAADACRSMGLTRRQALWDVRALDRAAPVALAPVREDPVQADLPLMPVSEEVVADYQTTRLSLRGHPMGLLRAHYRAQGLVRSDRMVEASGPMRQRKRGQSSGRTIEVAGLVLVRQRPGSANGVCFLTLEDEAGPINVVVWPTMMERYRRVVMASRLMRVTGRIQTADAVVHLVADHMVDATEDLALLNDGEAMDDMLRTGTLRADHVTSPLPSTLKEPPPRTHPRDVRVIPGLKQGVREFH